MVATMGGLCSLRSVFDRTTGTSDDVVGFEISTLLMVQAFAYPYYACVLGDDAVLSGPYV